MNNIINIEDAKPESPAIMAANYYLVKKDEYGEEGLRVLLHGDEHIETTCPRCCKQHKIDIIEFLHITGVDFEFFGSMISCDECSSKHQ